MAAEMEIKISHPDRIIYPDTKTTKKDVVRYFEEIAPLLLPYVKDRPISILRCQDTALSGCYFQKHTHTTNLVGIRTKEVHKGKNKDSALVIEDVTDVIRLIQAGTIEIHGWQARFSNIEKPDQIVFDLDPDTPALWGRMVDTAFEIRGQLKTLGLESFVKLTGGKGIHVQLPIEARYSWELIKSFSKSLMQILSEQNPGYYTTNMQKINRKGKIFLDYLRNSYEATAIIPYSLRARAEPTVALPIAWKDLKHSSGADEYTYQDVLQLVKKRKDPWSNYFRVSQRITILEKKPKGAFLNQNSGRNS